MEFGVQMVFQAHGYPGIPDGRIAAEGLRLAELADELNHVCEGRGPVVLPTYGGVVVSQAKATRR